MVSLPGLVIGGGSAAVGSVAVPSVVGRTQAEAEQKLRDFGLVPRARVVEADEPDGTVVSQNPVENTIRPRGTTVNLFVAKRPVVPTDIVQTLTDMVEAVEAVGIAVTAVDGKVDGIGTKVDGLETEAAAAARHKEILDRLDKLAGPAAAAPGGAADAAPGGKSAGRGGRGGS
ncbi:PASTA domain-containing protein [Virgisporangium aurantiacum]|uniref:PASTA domain-containing protein n=1 Tax=Virgisporangium aurantiacum TaxID=175570 RepID=A0A8J4E6F5_9ACTN|nr:PASTA domain-containing protein [Virgisporangium aurantiacum]GIJ64030.1 hypothetical protein Vau01_115460 [Virgisporangium aurantiacum]